MSASSSTPATFDSLLRLLRNAHLQRMARFALVDDVPSPWDGVVLPEQAKVAELRSNEKE